MAKRNATRVHQDGRVTGQVEVVDGRGRPFVVEFETVEHAEPLAADGFKAWAAFLLADVPGDLARIRATRHTATSAA